MNPDAMRFWLRGKVPVIVWGFIIIHCIGNLVVAYGNLNQHPYLLAENVMGSVKGHKVFWSEYLCCESSEVFFKLANPQVKLTCARPYTCQT